MASPTDDDADRDDALLRRVFAMTGGAGAPPDAERLRAAEATFRDELASRRRARRRVRVRIAASVAATVVVAVGIGLSVVQRPTAVEPAAAQLVSVTGRVDVLGAGAAQPRTSIASGATLTTADDGRAALRYRGADVRLDVATAVRFDTKRLVLERGAVYVDSGGGQASAGAVVVDTPFGVVGHTGTQFLARVDADRLTVGVREGSIYVESGATRRDLRAEPAVSTIAEIARDGAVRVATAPRYGGVWAWVPTASPGFAADGRSVAAYLEWLGKEYGYAVEYANESAEVRAHATDLHGDLSGLALGDTLTAVSETTDVVVTLDADGALRVRSKGQ